jgi:hypothetical protein
MSRKDQRAQTMVAVVDPGQPGSVLTPSINNASTIVPGVGILSPPLVGLYVGGTGSVVVRMTGNQAVVTFLAVPAGTFLPISVDQVQAGSTATGMLGLW